MSINSETILREIQGMSEQERMTTLANLVQANYDLNLRYQKDVGRMRQLMNRMVEILDSGHPDGPAVNEIVGLIRFYKDNR